MRELQDLRNEIDAVDDALIALLKQRLALSREVAEYKAAKNLPVYDAAREQAILDKAAAECGGQKDAIQAVFSAVLDASRKEQQQWKEHRKS